MIMNPMWFYWMSVFDKAQWICFIMGVITVFIGCLVFSAYISDGDDDTLRAAKRLFLIALCFGLVGIFTPSEKTMIKMLIANQVNETNIERAKEVVDYIIDKINEAKGE